MKLEEQRRLYKEAMLHLKFYNPKTSMEKACLWCIVEYYLRAIGVSDSCMDEVIRCDVKAGFDGVFERAFD